MGSGFRVVHGAQQITDVQRAVSRSRGDHMEADDGGEHDQAAEQVVQQELQRGLRTASAPVSTDEEVEGNQRGFERDVEEQNVERDKRQQDQCLDAQHQRDVCVGRQWAVSAVVPAGDDQQWHQRRGKCHQHERDAVEPDGVSGIESRDPLMGFDELILCAVDVEPDDQRCGHGQNRECNTQADPIGKYSLRGRQQQHDAGADYRPKPQDRQPRKRSHYDLTTRSTATTTAVLANMARA